MRNQIINLAFESIGNGVPIVLLHGYPLHRAIWQEVTPSLAAKAHVIIPDLRGHGASPLGDDINTMEDMAADVAAILDRLGIQQTALAGHSMGGYVSLAFARLYPQRVLGLSLVASHPLADNPDKAQTRLASAQRIESEGLAFLAEEMPQKLSANPQLFPRIAQIISENSPQGAAADQRGMAARLDESQTLSNLNAPGLVICGSADPFVNLDIAREASQMMSQGELAVIEGAAHMPMLEFPAATSQALLGMLAKIK
jgi:pimeloyl-ACP methyl ester carboxylesterase